VIAEEGEKTNDVGPATVVFSAQDLPFL